MKALNKQFSSGPAVAADSLLEHCRVAGPDDPIRLGFHSLLADWDYRPTPEWDVLGPTRPSTAARRLKIYDLLLLKKSARSTCDSLFPYSPAVDQVQIIADNGSWLRWYTSERESARHFYWDAYEAQLKNVRKWDAQNLASMRQSTVEVVERMSDPQSATPRSTKGLVVGYVQSGKTANFTGVIARAADAGYRLFIVLAGTQNTLRDQTQRRLDKELVGKELLGDEYSDSDDYNEFVSHGGRPSHVGSFDWERLTYATEDFKHLQVGLAALRFKKVQKELPFRDSTNLHREAARLIVIKKNQGNLEQLIQSLKEAETHVQWADVPSIVIDDESDQASVNTRRPSEARDRSRINELIVQLLALLKCTQYVGYTATPFANVLTNPDDAADLFPSDYILPLPRPAGYMGVKDFYDDGPRHKGDYSSNQQAFVRNVIKSDALEHNLPQAIDAFVLSGALKLFRQHADKRKYRHHTMLVHQSTAKRDQRIQANVVEKMFLDANYCGSIAGKRRLETLWKKDFEQVSAVQRAGLSMPRSFDELLPFVGACYSKIIDGERPVIVLNGDHNEDAPDFDRTPIWKIIVGGAKLSRGYTVEGLTISYYRRRAGAADTLMQMGRWFGYRDGYRDFVRLYIGREEPTDKKGKRTIDLYEAFRSVCHDEEEFRLFLRLYGSLEEGERITPKQVHPLVPSHMLQPTAKNKRFNARMTFNNYGGLEVQRTTAPTGLRERRINLRLMDDLLAGEDIKGTILQAKVGNDDVEIDALFCDLELRKTLTFLSEYKWASGHEHTLKLVREFLEGKAGNPNVNRCLMLAPQSKGAKGSHTFGSTKFSIRERSRSADGKRYLVYSEPDHILMARFLAGVESGKALNTTTASLQKPDQAILLFYPVLSKQEAEGRQPPTVGFVLAFPKNGIKKRVQFTAYDPRDPDAIVVPAS